MPRLFVSYSRVDRVIAEEIVRLLRRVYGHDAVWMDSELTGGDIWWEVILDQVAASDIFLYLLSNESVTSPYCQAEYTEAVRLRKRIVLAQVRDRTKLTDSLKERQYVTLTDWRDAEQMTELHRAITKQAEQVKRSRPRWRGRTAHPSIPSAEEEIATASAITDTAELIHAVPSDQPIDPTVPERSDIAAHPVLERSAVEELLAAGTDLLPIEDGPIPDAEPPAVPSPTIRREALWGLGALLVIGVLGIIGYLMLGVGGDRDRPTPTPTQRQVVAPSSAAAFAATPTAPFSRTLTTTGTPTSTPSDTPTVTSTPTLTATLSATANPTNPVQLDGGLSVTPNAPTPVSVLYPTPSEPSRELLTTENVASLQLMGGWSNPSAVRDVAYVSAYDPPNRYVIASTIDGVWRYPVGIAGEEALKVDDGTNIRLAANPTSQRLYIGRSYLTAYDPTMSQTYGSYTNDDYVWLSTVVVSADGTRLAANTNATVYVWRESGTDLIATLRSGSLNVIAFVNYTTLLTGSSDGILRVWDIPSETATQAISTGGGAIRAVLVVEQYALLANSASAMTVYNLSDGGYVRRFSGHTANINDIAINGSLVASAAEDMTVRLWDWNTGETLNILSAHQAPVNAVAFSKDGTALVSADEAGTILVWGVE